MLLVVYLYSFQNLMTYIHIITAHSLKNYNKIRRIEIPMVKKHERNIPLLLIVQLNRSSATAQCKWIPSVETSRHVQLMNNKHILIGPNN